VRGETFTKAKGRTKKGEELDDNEDDRHRA
jgi:hypothetical protein